MYSNFNSEFENQYTLPKNNIKFRTINPRKQIKDTYIKLDKVFKIT